MKKVFYVAPATKVNAMKSEQSILAGSPVIIIGGEQQVVEEDDGTHIPDANEQESWGNLWD
jgi:hypothetical protein